MNRSLVIISRIILYYSIFYPIMKIIAIAQGAWLLPNLIIAAPFIILAILGWKIDRQKNYSWMYVIVGVLVISIIRYYEAEWVFWLNQTLSS